MPGQPITAFRLILPVMLIYGIISTIGILHHEIWLDEAQHFLIARDSNSLAELSSNMRYDGHVQLWNYALFFITHYISDNVLAMQLFHLLIINTAAFILLRYAPFSLIIKILILLSYYFLFEYSLISRNYALGIAFLFTCCALLYNTEKNIIVIGIMLMLLCNTHLFFFFTAIAISFVIFQSYYQQKRLFTRSFIIFGSFFLAGMILAVIPMLRIPADNTYFHPWQRTTTLLSASSISFPLYSPARGFLPLQSPEGIHYWNTYLFDQFHAIVKIPVSLALLIFPVWALRKNKSALFFNCICTFLLLLFLFITQMKGNRYFGMFFIYFLTAAWIAANQGINILSITVPYFKVRSLLSAAGVFILMLLIQVTAGVYAYAEDIRRPFSQSKNAVQYMQQHQLDKHTVLIDGYGSGPAISAYLRKPVFYLDINRQGSYCQWRQDYFHVPPLPLLQEISSSAYASGLDSFILVTSRAVLQPGLQNDNNIYTFKKYAHFINSSIKPEYFIYQVIKTGKITENKMSIQSTYDVR